MSGFMAPDIEALVAKHKDAVYHQMVRVCGNREDAEDALADAVIAAFQASSQLRDHDAFRAWLTKIGSRACTRSRIRTRVRDEVSLAALEELGLEIPAAEPGPEEAVLEAETKGCVQRALEVLPEIFREVYIRREIMREPGEEVAESLGLSLPAMKSRLHRARSLVREALDSDLGCID